MDQVILKIYSTHVFIFFLIRIHGLGKNYLNVYPAFSLSINLMMLIIPTFLGFSRTALRTQIDGSTIFHWTYFPEMYYGNFALKQEVQYSKNFWLWKFLPKSQWLLWKSKIKYLDWVFASSNVQQTERLLNSVQSIEWIVNIK